MLPPKMTNLPKKKNAATAVEIHCHVTRGLAISQTKNTTDAVKTNGLRSVSHQTMGSSRRKAVSSIPAVTSTALGSALTQSCSCTSRVIRLSPRNLSSLCDLCNLAILEHFAECSCQLCERIPHLPLALFRGVTSLRVFANGQDGTVR